MRYGRYWFWYRRYISKGRSTCGRRTRDASVTFGIDAGIDSWGAQCVEAVLGKFGCIGQVERLTPLRE